MFHLSRHHLHSHRGRTGNADSTLERQKEEKKHRTERAVSLVLSGATAGGLGYLHGRKAGMPNFKGIPLDGAIAALAIGASMWKPRARWSPWGFAIGLGAWNYFAGSLGAAYGQKKRKDAGEFKNAGPLSADDAKAASVSPRAIASGGPIPSSYVPTAAMPVARPSSNPWSGFVR